MNSRIKQKPMYRYLLILTMASAAGLHGWRVLFNNFAADIVGANGFHVGMIQSFREIPGFLAFASVFLLYFLKEHRLSAVSVFLLGTGIALTGFFPSFLGLLATTVLMSLGFHYYEVTNQSLILQNFDEYDSPLVMGQQRSMMSLTCILVVLLVLFMSFHFSYKIIFMTVGGVAIAAGLWGLIFPVESPMKTNAQHKKIVFKRKYGLFYFLTLLSGARRQIFMVFSIFLLVEKFHFSLQEVTFLFLLNNFINFFAAPAVAKAIKRFGERTILSVEYGSLTIIFAAYAFCPYKTIVVLLYILDHISFNGAMAIRTYFQKIAHPEDIAASTAVSFTINHVAAVVLPVLGGYLWLIDPKIPFLLGVGLSSCSFLLSQGIKHPQSAQPGKLKKLFFLLSLSLYIDGLKKYVIIE